LIGYGSDGTNLLSVGAVQFFVDGTPGTNDMPGRIVFSTTADGASSLTERLRIDSSGNLGLGVTPSAWGSTFPTMQIGDGGAITARSNKANEIYLGANAYHDGSTGWRYIETDYATNYYQFNGAHVWRTAPSGTAGNAISFTQAMTLDASGNLGIGTTTPTEKLDVTGNIKASGSIIAPYIYAGNIATIGSFTWNTATSSPAAAINVGTTTVTPIHSGMRRCLMNDSGVVQYYLSPTNSALKADGTASVLTGADGQVMVEIPAFYTRREVSGTFITWYVSPVELPGYTLHPAFTKDGVQVPFRYYGAYDACVFDVSASAYISGLNWDNNSGAGNGVAVNVTATTGDVLASVSGVFPMVGLTRAEFRTIAANRGTGWRQIDWTLFSAVQLLYLIEYQSFYSQNILGAGNTATTYAASSGTQSDNGGSEAGKSNSIGNASTNTTNGASSASRGVAWMSYRGIENFYGNEWNWADGCIVNPDGTASAGQGDWWFTNNSADFSDSVRTNMTQIMSTAPTTSGFVSALASVDNFFIATSVSGGSSTTYLTDQYFASTSADRMVRVGGNALNGANAGAFSVSATADAALARTRDVGGRLAF
jgi:hypothetical protein